MNFFKRAIRYCWRQKVRSVILFFTLTVLATAACTALSMGNATTGAASEVKEIVGGSIHMEIDGNNKDNYGPGQESEFGVTYQYNADYITDEVIEAVSKVDGVIDCSGELEGGYYGAPVDFAYFPGTFNISYTDFGQSAAYTVTRNSALNKKFLNGTYTLEEGRHLNPEDSYAVLISKELAEKNGLSVGDHITLYSLDSNAQDTFEIVGLFGGTEGMNKDAFMADGIPANCGYIDLNSYNDIFGCQQSELTSLDVYINLAENAQQILEAIQNLPEVRGKTFLFYINNENFELISNPLSSIQIMVNSTVKTIAAIGAVLITLLLVLWTRNRKKEVGILLAIGRKKGEIAGQFLAENLLVALPAALMSGILSLNLAGKVAGQILHKTVSDAAGVIVTVKATDMLMVYGIGLLILCFAITVSVATVIRLKPGEILAKMS